MPAYAMSMGSFAAHREKTAIEAALKFPGHPGSELEGVCRGGESVQRAEKKIPFLLDGNESKRADLMFLI